MPYGILKVDNITFDNGGADQNVTVSGIYKAITSGVTVSGTISGAVIIGGTSVSGTTVRGTTVTGTTVQGVGGTFTTLTGVTTTGTTANFASGVFTTRISGLTVTGTTAQFTSGTFVSLTGTTVTGTTINAGTVNSTTGTFTSLTGTTITGATVQGTTVVATTGNFTSLTGITTTGTTANFTSGIFTAQVSGLTVTGTQSSFTSGNFITLSGSAVQGGTGTFTSGVFASGLSAANPSISFVADPNTGIYSPGADTLAFTEGGVEAMRIDSSGRLLVGTTTARTNFGATDLSAALQIEGTDYATSSLSLTANGISATTPVLRLVRSKGTAVGSNTIVADNDLLGVIDFEGSDGTRSLIGARIEASVDGTPGVGDMPGRLVFQTTADGDPFSTERMQINSGGDLLVNTSIASPGFGNPLIGFGFEASSNALNISASANESLRLNRNSDGTIVVFRRSGDASPVGSISVTTTATAYNTSSDYRIKENIVTLSGAIARLNQLPVHRFNFIADPDTVVDGFIAHEAAAVVPECVTGEKDEVDEDGDPVYQGIDQSKLVPLLTAALQEAIAKIDALEARLAALEA